MAHPPGIDQVLTLLAWMCKCAQDSWEACQVTKRGRQGEGKGQNDQLDGLAGKGRVSPPGKSKLETHPPPLAG